MFILLIEKDIQNVMVVLTLCTNLVNKDRKWWKIYNFVNCREMLACHLTIQSPISSLIKGVGA